MAQLGTRNVIRHTIGELYGMNTGETLPPGKTLSILNSYPPPSSKISEYANKHNKNFKFVTDPNGSGGGGGSGSGGSSGNGRSARGRRNFNMLTRSHCLSDDRVIEDIRDVINNISNDQGKVRTAIERLSQLSIPKTQIDNIAGIFYDSMIECDFLIEQYMDVLFGFKNVDKELLKAIYIAFSKLCVSRFKEPKVFEDTATETGPDKTKRFRVNNVKIIAHLYQRCPNPWINSYFNTANIVKSCLTPIFEGMDPADEASVQVLTTIWDLLSGEDSRLLKENQEQYNKYRDQIKEWSTTKGIRMMVKVKLMNLLSKK